MMEVPRPILSAAITLLKPYVPEITAKALTHALNPPQAVAPVQAAMEKPMTRREAAEFLKVSLETVKRLMRAGKIRATKIGHSVRIDPRSVRALLAYEEPDRQDRQE